MAYEDRRGQVFSLGSTTAKETLFYRCLLRQHDFEATYKAFISRNNPLRKRVQTKLELLGGERINTAEIEWSWIGAALRCRTWPQEASPELTTELIEM
ncbi:unnamed protein product [Victoria cruziana]